MEKPSKLKPIAIAVGAGLVITLGGMNIANADTQPFSAKTLEQPYMLSGTNTDGGCGAGKCGAGNCGADKTKNGSADADADADASKSSDSTTDDSDKATDGKCGTGKCGGSKK